jgi:hypothetical protein
MRTSQLVLVVAAVFTWSSCSRTQDIAVEADEGGFVNGPCNAQSFDFSGSLAGQEAQVRGALGSTGGRLHRRLDRGAKHTDVATPRYTMYPTCKNQEFTTGDLVDGRFVGVLVISDDSDRNFSRTKNSDTVGWWVYGQHEADGRIRLYSQFLSLTVPDDPVMTQFFDACPKSGTWREETAGWHGEVCEESAMSEMVAPRIGDNPWFGCTRGCCYSTKLQRLTDSLPADTSRADTTRRDTTRRDTTP